MVIHSTEWAFIHGNETVDPIQAQLILARRNQILDAATQVFAEKGFQRATIRDIARAAGIADGTIYNYFENKTALMLGILDRLNESDRREEDFAQLDAVDLRSAMERYMRQRIDRIMQDGVGAFQVVLAEVIVNPELRELYKQQIVEPTFALAEKYVARLAEAGKLKPDHLRLALRMMGATFLGIMILRILEDPVLEAYSDTLPDVLTAMILDGLEP